MPDNDQTSKIDLTRRKILAASGAIGASGAGAGLGANALFSDQEQFANNQIEAGELDLKVDWQVDYYNGLPPDPTTISISDTDGDDEPNLVDDPGPIVDLQDVKPGDVIEHTLSLHLFGNPGFITMDGLLTADSDNGFTEPEDQVDGILDNSDGTSDGDLDDHLQCVVWFDDGDGLPQEIWNTSYSQTEEFIDDLIDGNVSFDTNAEEFLFQGTLASLMSTLSGGLLLDPRVNGHVANDYPNSFCFQPSITEYLGILCWLPRDIPGVDDNIVQSDRLKYELGFDANQCRNNIENNGRPAQRPTGGVQPLTFEVGEGYGTLGGGPVDLQSDVGFPEDMVTGVDTSSDPVEFVLDLPQGLDKSANDQWSLVFDADDDGTVDFRVVFDEFFYQEWDDDQGEWGQQQPVPADIETAIINGIYVVGIPRERLSDPFSFGGRVCYRDPPSVDGLGSNEDLCVSLTPDLVPRTELGQDTSDFEQIVIQAIGDDFPIDVVNRLRENVSIDPNSRVTFGPVPRGFKFVEQDPFAESPTELQVPDKPGDYYAFIIDERFGHGFAHPVQYAWLERTSGEYQAKPASWNPILFANEEQVIFNGARSELRKIGGGTWQFKSSIKAPGPFAGSKPRAKNNLPPLPQSTPEFDGFKCWNCYALVLDGGGKHAGTFKRNADGMDQWLGSNGFLTQRISQAPNVLPGLDGAGTGTLPSDELLSILDQYKSVFNKCCEKAQARERDDFEICFFIFLNGHGVRSGLYLNRPKVPGRQGIDRLSYRRILKKLLKEFPECVRVTIFIDACHSGAAKRIFKEIKSSQDSNGDFTKTEGIITSCKEGETTLVRWWNSRDHDDDGDGKVDLDEIVDEGASENFNDTSGDFSDKLKGMCNKQEKTNRDLKGSPGHHPQTVPDDKDRFQLPECRIARFPTESQDTESSQSN